MKLLLSLIGIVLSISFPCSSAFALTLPEKGAELANPFTEAGMMVDDQNLQNKHVTEQSVAVKGAQPDALIAAEGERYSGADDDSADVLDEYVDSQGKGSK